MFKLFKNKTKSSILESLNVKLECYKNLLVNESDLLLINHYISEIMKINSQISNL